MTSALRTSRLREEDGFTLVEVLVAMVISTILLFATLQTLDTFTSTSARESRVTDANAQARLTMDHIVLDLRNGAGVLRAGPNDLVYSVKQSTSVTRYSRYCLDGSQRLRGEQSTTSADPGVGCPSTAGGWTSAKLTTMASTNSVANPLFRYDSGTATAVRSIGLTFTLDASGAGRSVASTLRASAFLRSQGERAPVVSDGDIQATCTPSGPLVNFGLVSNLVNGPVTVAVNGVGIGGSSVQLLNGVSSFTATITNALGLTTVINKDVKCN
jgi:prepilin-type N-terminal cleavage/methylation domain-containing protein